MAGRSIALFIVLRATAFAQTGSIEGRVVDPTGAVVPFVDVDLKIPGKFTPVDEARTDATGRFGFAAVAPGTYELLVSAAGFERHGESVRVIEGQETEVPKIALRVGEIAKCGPGPLGPPTISSQAINSSEAELYGSVGGMSGWFVAQVRVSLSPIDKNSRPTTIVTGPDSSFSFTGIAPGIYTLRATRKGYSDFVIDRLELKAGQRMDIIEPLEMLDCLEGFRCEPNRQVHTSVLCL
jgi:hypothetical protein